MTLTQLNILNYKNIQEAELTLAPNINCFTGHNGQGKTNLLDAIYNLAFCKSAHNTQDTHTLRHNTNYYLIQAKYLTHTGEQGTITNSYKLRNGKHIKHNNTEYRRLSDHIGLLPAILISPADNTLTNGTSEERRRLMDIAISQYNKNYLQALIRYNRALTARNALIKTQQTDHTLLNIYNETLDQESNTIYNARHNFCQQLQPLFNQIHTQLANTQEQVTMTYRSHLQEEPLLPQLHSTHNKELLLGYTLRGTHRDDIDMTLNQQPLRREGSQGQIKTYTISLKLALALLLTQQLQGNKPLLLLDDIFDRLDNTRVRNIIQTVSNPRFGQIFITDTNPNNLQPLLNETATHNNTHFTVKEGQLHPLTQ